jgi:biotin carboxylase
MARVLVLLPTTSYRGADLAAAARRLGVEAVLGTDRCHMLAELWPREAFGGSLPLDLRDADAAARAIVDDARARPFDAIVATDETTAHVAALAAGALGLRGNAPSATAVARDKSKLRATLETAGVPTPRARVFPVDEPPRDVRFPCVVKPLLLSGSRGVMRADDDAGFAAAWRRLAALLATPPLRGCADPSGHAVLVEEFIAGAEVALEGLLADGRLTVLALFDKPDPLDGPFFEETLYVTPSRHSFALQQSIADVTARAAAAIGLVEGPVHAELRLGAGGPVVIEVAARSIGGLCSRTLRFGLGGRSLEELVLSHALGRPIGDFVCTAASGVMMIPIPRGGVLRAVGGVAAARAVPLVEDVVITVRIGEVLVPLPEGASYLGFVFARGEAPAAVEEALRAAHRALSFDVAPLL